MSKKRCVERESWDFSPTTPVCDVYRPSQERLEILKQREDLGQAPRLEDGVFFIVPGLGSVKADYGRLARSMAASGYTVISPNCNQPATDTEYGGALDRRAEIVTRAMCAFQVGRVRLISHSLGGPVSVKVRQQLSELGHNAPIVESVSFLQSAGFDSHGPTDLVRGARFIFGEAVPRTLNLLPDLIMNLPTMYERLDLAQRWREVRELWGLPEDFMTDDTKKAVAEGVAIDHFVGPKDTLTRPEPIRRAVEPLIGPDHVIDIHPQAGHLSAQRHPSQTARRVLGQLMIYQGSAQSRPELAA